MSYTEITKAPGCSEVKKLNFYEIWTKFWPFHLPKYNLIPWYGRPELLALGTVAGPPSLQGGLLAESPLPLAPLLLLDLLVLLLILPEGLQVWSLSGLKVSWQVLRKLESSLVRFHAHDCLDDHRQRRAF